MVNHAVFTRDGQEFMAMDSGHDHSFTFTRAMSIFVTCKDEKEIDGLFAKLSQGGKIHMLLNEYAFSRKFGWVDDKFECPGS